MFKTVYSTLRYDLEQTLLHLNRTVTFISSNECVINIIIIYIWLGTPNVTSNGIHLLKTISFGNVPLISESYVSV